MFPNALRLISSVAVAALLLAGGHASADTQPIYDIAIDRSTELEDLFPAIREADDFGGGFPDYSSEDQGDLETFPRIAMSSIVFGQPTVVDTDHGAGLRLDSVDAGVFYEQVRLELGLAAEGATARACQWAQDEMSEEEFFLYDLHAIDYSEDGVGGYAIEVEFVVDRLAFWGSNKNFSVFYDGVCTLNRIDFTPDGKVLIYSGSTTPIHLGRYPVGEKVALRADFDFDRPSMVLELDGREIFRSEDEDLAPDLRAIRFSLAKGMGWPAPSVTVHDVYVESTE